MRKFRPPIKDEDRLVTDPERSKRKTFDRAVNLLTFKPRSVEELRTRLLEKVWTNKEIVDDVIEKLTEYNYLNDKQFAASFAASKIRQKPIGRRRLAEDLKKKKLDNEVIDGALESVFEETAEDSIIDRAIEKRLRIKGPPANYNERQSFFGYLARLGFEYDLIRTKLDGLPSPDEEE